MISKTEFVNKTSKFFATGRSRPLKKVDTELGNYHHAPSEANAKKLAHAIIQWAGFKGLKPNGDINSGRNPQVVRQLVLHVAALQGGGILLNLPQAIKNLPQPSAHGAVGHWVKQVKPELDKMKEFASLDAFFGCTRKKGQAPVNWEGFASCINPGKRADVMDRHDSFKGSIGMPAILRPGSEWRAPTLRMGYQRAYEKKAGICTLFAQAAAHILTDQRECEYLVEMVAFKNHVFVIVGRNPGTLENNFKLPPVAQWGNDWWIVDGWAGAMGWEVIYQQKQGYPYISMLEPVELIMSSDSE